MAVGGGTAPGHSGHGPLPGALRSRPVPGLPGSHPVTDIAAVVLAAGEGRRLRPLTHTRPKALCPVGNVPLLDRALDRLDRLGFTGRDTVAVNACYLAGQMVAHLGDRTHLSVEPGTPLGTAGGLGRLRPWIAGRGVLVGNADAYLASPHAAPGPDIAALLDGWDGRSVRILGVPAAGGETAEFGRHRFAGFSLLPWADVAALPAEPGNLVRTTWRPAERQGRLEVVEFPGRYRDTGTPADYLAANLD
ncbi:MAG: NTP transferase domain-containing protein, partial [Dactylosporangium sp.]|nr:NTP transferase domain-containing protein [Dactylosporangium sp.]NNJ62961.1 NTP transferase domain-containing protein [Dactylosporangium sp.]